LWPESDYTEETGVCLKNIAIFSAKKNPKCTSAKQSRTRIDFSAGKHVLMRPRNEKKQKYKAELTTDSSFDAIYCVFSVKN
jgi:hypothetical protein